MGLFRPTRARRGPDPYYDWKVGAFTLGAALGLAGIFTNRDSLVLVAVPILALGIALRWLPRRGTGSAADHEPDDDEAPSEESEPEGAHAADERSSSDAPPPEDSPPQ